MHAHLTARRARVRQPDRSHVARQRSSVRPARRALCETRGPGRSMTGATRKRASVRSVFVSIGEQSNGIFFF
jgi:hypothetical protein